MRKPEFIARQGRRPSGLLGRLVARIMASETTDENEVALELLGLGAGDRFLEVGFGHGRTLAKASAAIGDGLAAGVDFSDVMYRAARRWNRRRLRAGRVELKLANSERIPYADLSFGKVLSVHTIYFWTQPDLHLGEIHRVMVPGGRLVLGYRPREDERFVGLFPASVYRIRPLEEVEALVARSGFRIVETVSRSLGSRLMAWTLVEKP